MTHLPDASEGDSSSIHRPVLVREVLELLDLEAGQIVVDGTVGAGGHSTRILDAIGSTGVLIGLDRDTRMLEFAKQRLSESECHLFQSSYVELDLVIARLGIENVDRILVDSGLSSDQLADDSRGFSFDSTGPLDLRFDSSSGRPAWKYLQETDRITIAEVIERYGEERFSGRIADEIDQRRDSRPVRSAADLVDAVHTAVPPAAKKSARRHSATRVFQALRIAVNDELDHLEQSLDRVFPDVLKPGGRLVVISFHSLEDRLIKQAFRRQEQWENLTPKPNQATPLEARNNPRSRSAKVRAAIRR